MSKAIKIKKLWYPLLYCGYLGEKLFSLFAAVTGGGGKVLWSVKLWGRKCEIATSLRSSQ